MRLLIIGRLDSEVNHAAAIAKSKGAQVINAPDINTALETLRSGNGADMLLVDVKDNIELLVKHLDSERISIPVVGYGISASKDDAARAIRAGAKEYIPLPPEEDLIAAILTSITEENNTLIYKSPAMQATVKLIEQVAPSDASVLITGESGTGKEIISRYIHQKSKRAKEKFISVNCAAIPENLLESEMFGHEKGAFTGAIARRIGKFEEANNGTLLLDEISEMDLRLQAKLLRVIQEKEITRVGGNEAVKLNVRILATSNRNLPKEIKDGSFREDLYFRLNVINASLPSLKERKEDIPLFAEHFIKKYSENNGLPIKSLSDGALKRMQSYNWPGNVRELENTMHRAVLLSTGNQIEESAIMLSEENSGDTESGSGNSSGTSIGAVGMKVADVEKQLILDTLQHCLGNRTNAANILGISIRTLRNKLNEYGVSEDGKGSKKAG